MDKITLTLTAQAYNLMMQAVQELPWKLANPVIQEIDPQIRAALAKDGQTGSPPSTPEISKMPRGIPSGDQK